MADEVIDDTKPYEIFNPNHTWKRKTVDNFVAREMLVPVFKKGECVYKCPSLEDIRAVTNRLHLFGRKLFVLKTLINITLIFRVNFGA